jgi:hypothetical protein
MIYFVNSLLRDVYLNKKGKQSIYKIEINICCDIYAKLNNHLKNIK